MSVLVLGAGMVSGPVFEFLHGHNIPFSVGELYSVSLFGTPSLPLVLAFHSSLKCYLTNKVLCN